MSIPLIDANDEEDHSLFGSPTASPVRGRSPSPLLALPSSYSASQNVGTIALPGSQHFSERSTHSTASSLNSCAQRPPNSEPSQTKRNQQDQCPRRGRTQSRQKFARLTPPPIELPDPDKPVPANFLRNQQALLGHAGLVANLKPLNLYNPVAPGTSLSHPIVVDDEFGAPLSGCGRGSQSTGPSPGHSLAAPGDVIDTLVRQKNLIPVLHGLLKLLSPSAPLPPPRTGFERNSSRSKKRRRLADVPAGAVDWDVPYPFPAGQGPSEYHANWERMRTRHLIAQLVTLVRGAAEKTSARALKESNPKGAARRYPTPSSSTSSTSPPQSMIPLESTLTSIEDHSQRLFDAISQPSELQTELDSTLLNQWLALLQTLPPPEPPIPQNEGEAVAASQSTPDSMIDPTLLGLSLPTPGFTSDTGSNLFFPPTPSGEVPFIEQTVNFLPLSDNTIPNTEAYGAQPEQGSEFEHTHVDLAPVPFVGPSQVSERPAVSPTVATVASSTTGNTSRMKVSEARAEILRRAQERRRAVAAEIERSKVELWESTLEQGVLAHIAKEL